MKTPADVLFKQTSAALVADGWQFKDPDRWTRPERGEVGVTIETGTASGEVTVRVSDSTQTRNGEWLGFLRVTSTHQIEPTIRAIRELEASR